MKKIVFILLLLISLNTNATYDIKSGISKVSIVNLEGKSLDYSILSAGFSENNNKVELKYLLGGDTLFKIEGSNFIGSEYAGTLKIIIDDEIYESKIHYKNLNTNSTIYFGTEEIKDLLLNSITKQFKFQFCPYSPTYGEGECGTSNTIYLDKLNLSNDKYSYMQYYLDDMNIIKAKKNLDTKNQVIIAIIDDGISINHEDLKGKYWYNTDELNGNGIDDDNNGYIDDYYGWNFIDNSNFMYPKGDHGTSIAGIIGANDNNELGIYGIVDNVKLMPIITCTASGCENDNIVKAINYSVDNGVNIINLSLGGFWFNYEEKIKESIKYANEKGVVVIISAGNGDSYLTGRGINTTEHKISPVCNQENKYDVIGVAALSKFSDKTINGLLTDRSNYGDCADFSAYGEDIVSISFDGGYSLKSGTSFSAPIISGIIGIGYNKYGKVKQEYIYNALIKSTNKWHGIDAEKYIKELGLIIENENKKSIANINTINVNSNSGNIVIESSIDIKKEEYTKMFKEKIGLKLNKIPKNKLEKLVKQLIALEKGQKNEDLLAKIRALIDIINEILNKK